MIVITPRAKRQYPGTRYGALLVSGLGTDTGHPAMDDLIHTELGALRAAWAGYDRKAALATEPLRQYAAYYKQYNKTYHLVGQLESILLKGKGIPPASVPVQAMFLAEIKSLLLTAGHDYDCIRGDLTLDVCDAAGSFLGLSGKEQQLVQNDLYLADDERVLSSILNGPARRTSITAETARVLYFVYGVPGIIDAQLEEHLRTIASYLTGAVESAVVETMEII